MIVVGVGCSLGCPVEELDELVAAALAVAGAKPAEVVALATVDRRAREPGILALAAERGWPVELHDAEALRVVDVPTPSPVVAAHVGTPSVAEAAALRSARGGPLLLAKRRSPRATCAIARRRT